MKKLTFIAALSLAPLSVFAATHTCPAVANIQNTNGFYTVQKNGRPDRNWVGVTNDAADDAVKNFDSAIYYPHEDANVANGTLSKCSYKLASGAALDMQFRPQTRPAVSIQGEANWKRRVGPFGMTIFSCKGDPTSCSFTEVKK